LSEAAFEVRANLSSPQGVRSVGRQLFDNLILILQVFRAGTPVVSPGPPIFIRRDGPAGSKEVDYNWPVYGFVAQTLVFRKKRFFFTCCQILRKYALGFVAKRRSLPVAPHWVRFFTRAQPRRRGFGFVFTKSPDPQNWLRCAGPRVLQKLPGSFLANSPLASSLEESSPPFVTPSGPYFYKNRQTTELASLRKPCLSPKLASQKTPFLRLSPLASLRKGGTQRFSPELVSPFPNSCSPPPQSVPPSPEPAKFHCGNGHKPDTHCSLASAPNEARHSPDESPSISPSAKFPVSAASQTQRPQPIQTQPANRYAGRTLHALPMHPQSVIHSLAASGNCGRV
jgi:hypothetical protein